MISKRDTYRFSTSTYTTFSCAPSVATSTQTTTISDIDEGLRRLEDRRFAKQRFIPSEDKSEVLSKLALGAKLERALRRRMEGQDYIPRPRVKTG